MVILGSCPTRWQRAVAGVLAAAAVLTGCSTENAADSSGLLSSDNDPEAVTIGSADFPESQILAIIYSEGLQNAGIEVQESFMMGAREDYITSLLEGEIDLVPEYAGALSAYLGGEIAGTGTQQVLAQLDQLLADTGLERGVAAEAQNQNTLTVREATAEEYDLQTYSDLAPVAEQLSLGAPVQWEDRYDGLVGLREVYGIEFGSFSGLDAGGPLTLAAIISGETDVVNLFSTDPQITDYDLVVLTDDQELFPAENVLPLFDPDQVSPEAVEVLNSISAELSTEDLVEMNRRMTAGDTIRTIAQEWLSDHGVG